MISKKLNFHYFYINDRIKSAFKKVALNQFEYYFSFKTLRLEVFKDFVFNCFVHLNSQQFKLKMKFLMNMIQPVETNIMEASSHYDENMEHISDLANLQLAIRVFRFALIVFNMIVIFTAAYFSITGKDLFGDKLETHRAIIIFVCLCVVCVAVFGLLNGLWWGKVKNHAKVALAYAFGVTIVAVSSLISCFFLSDLSFADLLLIVLATIITVLLMGISYAMAFCLDKVSRYFKFFKKHRRNKHDH